MEHSDDSSVDTAEDFRMVKIPKIAWNAMKDNVKDLNKEVSALDQKVNAARLDNGKNECKIERLKDDKATMLKSLNDHHKDYGKLCTLNNKLENEKNLWTVN